MYPPSHFGARVPPLSLSFPFGSPLPFCVSAFLRALAAFLAVPSSRGSPRFPQDGSGCLRATPALVGTGTTGALPFVPARGSGSGSRRSSLWAPLLPSFVLCACLSASHASPPPLSPFSPSPLKYTVRTYTLPAYRAVLCFLFSRR